MKGIQVSSIEGPRPFRRGDNTEIAKIHLRNLKKVFFSRSIRPVQFQQYLVQSNYWEQSVKDCSNDGPHAFQRGDDIETVEIHLT